MYYKDGWKPPDLNCFTGLSSLLAFGTKPVIQKTTHKKVDVLNDESGNNDFVQ